MLFPVTARTNHRHQTVDYKNVVNPYIRSGIEYTDQAGQRYHATADPASHGELKPSVPPPKIQAHGNGRTHAENPDHRFSANENSSAVQKDIPNWTVRKRDFGRTGQEKE